MQPLLKKQVQKKIAEMENPYPADDLILSYSDFCKVRDCLGWYQFNPVVLENLIKLTNHLWTSKQRINRLSLLLKVRQYLYVNQQIISGVLYARSKEPIVQLSLETRILLFELFKKSYEQTEYISNKQLKLVRKICNNFLLNIALTPVEEEWLCANVSKSEFVLNRALRYPIKSDLISEWAKANFTNDLYRHRRAEIISWIIDQQPDYEVDQQTLIDDFEYLNKCDKQAVQIYKDEVFANKVLESDLQQYFPKSRSFNFKKQEAQETSSLSIPELHLFQRPYLIPTVSSREYEESIPDFETLEVEFFESLSNLQMRTMIWAIAYSKLDEDLKNSLLKKYYDDSTAYVLYKIAVRLKNVKLLKWMLLQ